MPLFSQKPRKGKLILILDVQSSMVRGSLVRMTPESIPEIIFSSSASVPHKAHTNSSYLIKAALRAIGEVVDTAVRRARFDGESIAEAHYALSSPWILSQAKAVSSSLPEETRVTKAMAMEMVSKERERVIARNEGKFEMVEEKVLDVRLNGYSIPEWQGRMAREISISYVVSIAGTAMLKRFREACERAAPARRVWFHSALLLQHIGMRAIMPDKPDYVLVHVHAELTDIAVVERHACVFFGSYPMGLDGILRMIAHGARCDANAAESLMSLYLDKSLDQEHMNSLEPAMRDAGNGWSGELRKLFKAEEFSGALPEEAILSARAHEAFFTASFKAAYPRAKVSLLSQDSISAQASFARGVPRSRLTGLYAAALRNLAGEL